jgi:hypothetical protein
MQSNIGWLGLPTTIGSFFPSIAYLSGAEMAPEPGKIEPSVGKV